MAEHESRVRLLQMSDDRSGFTSGNIDLDRFFQRYAGQNQFRHYVGVTYVTEVEGHISGYVTISSGEMTAEHIQPSMKKHLPDYPLPILRIARLAVDKRFQGLGLAKLLLKSMFELALEVKDRIGCVGVVVDAKPDAVGFYERLGFTPLIIVSGELGERPQPLPMFLPTRLIETASGR